MHFKSRDLSALHKQGQFWHIFFTSGSVIIAQDEIDTWTVHVPIPLDTDWSSLDPVKAVQGALGGSFGSLSLRVDEILVSSVWHPTIAIANQYTSSSNRVFLCGDAAHQNVPTGGYGMNTAVGDVFDLGWKLSAVIKGWGGKHLLQSYELERRPVGVRNIERSGVHIQVHQDYAAWVREAGPDPLASTSEAAESLKSRIREHVLSKDGENKDYGIELDYRYNHSPIVVDDTDESTEPEWNYRHYVPVTFPGSRPPHVFLADEVTSIFDLFGSGFTLVDFTADGRWNTEFTQVANDLGIPLKGVWLPKEGHTRGIWDRDAVLIRPDDHVAWRTQRNSDSVDIKRVLEIASGRFEH